MKKGDYIIAVNGEPVIFLGPREVKSKLKKSPRPMTVRFAHPCSKEDYTTITSPDGFKKTKKWDDSDVCEMKFSSTLGVFTCAHIPTCRDE